MKKDVQLQKNTKNPVAHNPISLLLQDANLKLNNYLDALRAADSVIRKDSPRDPRAYNRV